MLTGSEKGYIIGLMDYRECKVFESPRRNMCADGQTCCAKDKLQRDLELNPSLSAEAQMIKSEALEYVGRCQAQGCLCIAQLTQVANQFPETASSGGT